MAGLIGGGSLQGATAPRTQVADDDATLCASLPGKPARWSEILDRRSHRDTKLTTVLRVSESAVSEVVEKMVGDTGIEPVASSV
jgi:hypothetical protein